MALDEFRAKTLDARAEMIAFVLARDRRTAWLEARRREKEAETKAGYNPLDVQRRRWRL